MTSFQFHCNMRFTMIILLSSLLSSRHLFHTTITAVAAAEQIVCPRILFGSSASSVSEVLPDIYVNDGYCDCANGADEYATSACSGLGTWSGVGGHPQSSDDNDDSDRSLFVCSVEGTVLQSSKLNDSICDCCDGSDEIVDNASGSHDCPDTCGVLLKEREIQRKALEENFRLGYAAYMNDFEKFEQQKKLVAQELAVIDGEIKSKEFEEMFKEKKEALTKATGEYEKRNAEEYDVAYHEVISKLGLSAMSIDELEDLVVGIVYFTSTERHLQNAGKDVLGIQISDLKKRINILKREHEQHSNECDENVMNTLHEGVEESLDHYDRDMYEEEYYDYDYDLYDMDDDMVEYDLDAAEDDETSEISTCQESSEQSLGLPYVGSIGTHFKMVASNLLESGELIDSVSNALKSRIRTIEKSERSGNSARIILEIMVKESDNWNNDLIQIILSLLVDSKIGAVDFFTITSASLEEYRHSSNESLNLMCPLRFVQRNGNTSDVAIFPPDIFVKELEERCKEIDSRYTDEHDNYGNVILPTKISDGYLGYFQFVMRATEDPMESLLSALHEQAPKSDALVTLEKEVSDIDKELSSFKEKRAAVESKIPGIPELYPFHGHVCVNFVSGEYRYSICPNNQVTQHNQDAHVNDKGTKLGAYTDMTISPEDGSIMMKFENGLRCWNGVVRSAIINITCGPTHRVISAAEPETCVYHFSMESTIACNREYAIYHGIEIR